MNTQQKVPMKGPHHNGELALTALGHFGLFDWAEKKPAGTLFFYRQGGKRTNTTSLRVLCQLASAAPVDVYVMPAKIQQYRSAVEVRNDKGEVVGTEYAPCNPDGKVSREGPAVHDAEYIAIVAEHDDVSQEESLEIVANSGLPQPTFQIDSGGKSVHHWWLLQEPITQDQFVDAQKRLAQLLRSDTKVALPTQVFRLPGFTHAKGGRMCDFLTAHLDLFDQPVRHAYEDLEALLPALEEPTPAEPVQSPQQTDKGKKGRKGSPYDWFEMLSETVREVAAADMLAHVWQATAGDHPESHETRRKVVAGLVGWYRSPQKVVEIWNMACKDFGASWDKTTKTNMMAWATELIGGQNKRLAEGDKKHPAVNDIGTVIRYARAFGWTPFKYKQMLASDDGHLSKMVCADMFDGGENWVTYAGHCYEKVTDHYEHRDDIDLQRQISEYLDENFPTKSATHYAQGVLTWLKMRTGVTSRPNPDGYINCKNGILEIKPGGKYRLIEHDSEEAEGLLFFDAPKFVYDPNADRTEAYRLLECLPDKQGRAIFMRAMAFALNWEAAARRHGHGIAVFSRGEGSNGKDTNVIILKKIFGDSAITGLPLTQFSKADKDTSFALIELAKARLNIPSETNCQFKIDNLKYLKAVTSANQIWVEGKGVQGFMMTPKIAQMYPTNNEFILNNGKEADERRYMGLEWPYSYTTNQQKLELDPHSYKKADRRFLGHGEDEAWVCEKVVPGYFNILLEYFEEVCSKGFDDLLDYSRKVLSDMGERYNHIHKFLAEVGISIDPTLPKYHSKSMTPQDVFTQYYQPWCVESFRAEKLDEDPLSGTSLYRMITPRNLGAGSSDKTCESALDLMNRLADLGYQIGRINNNQADKLGLKRGNYLQHLAIDESVFTA